MLQHTQPSEEVYPLSEIVEKLKTFPSPEEAISFGLQFMRESISQEGAPRFRDFWETRTALLPYFKQNVNPAVRSKLWGEYVDLTIEARRLKDLFEEQSAFAAEQIELAIDALEQDVKNFEEILCQIPAITFPSEAGSIFDKTETYNLIQRELNLLNTLASRLNGLRQEITKTEMRIRNKTKFFKRLSEIGDFVFPKRKDLIERVSGEFSQDVELFVQRYFSGETPNGAPYYVLREAIKALQAWAKLLTLNLNTFTKIRVSLSECWDKVKSAERVHKQAFLQKKQVWDENRTQIETKIAAIKSQEFSDLKELGKAVSELEKELNGIELGREDLAFLRKEFSLLRAPIFEQEKKAQQEIEQAEQERLRQKKQKNDELRDRISALQKEGQKTYEELIKEFEAIRKEIPEVAQGKFEEQQFERLLRPIKDLILEKKEQILLSLSDDERNTLHQLHEALKERKKLRLEIKEQLESCRRALSGSNLDFERAISLQEQIENEKERIQKANASITEIEQKITEIEDRL